ncbi:UvrD-helicase domain-containing protein [bacterium]|nr:UvrD-helicase domain-containing protein [bacterium]MBU1152864.1 UvrD-helicase domain-containing protein [bacterium]
MGPAVTEAKDLKKELNPPQCEAVTYQDGPLLVLAGAGSGKTRVIAYRITHLVNLGISPYQILAVTFTNKAAKEMKNRVIDLVGVKAKPIWISTFHSSCVRILREYGDLKNFTIYDESDQLKLIKDCLQKLNVDEKQFKPAKILANISKAKENLIKPSDFRADHYFNKVVKDAYLAYQERLSENKALDFDDLILEANYLLSKRIEILETLQERFKYILVDEYQDINFAQYELIKQLSKKYQNVCVVGDDDQCIYQWRGADIYHLLNFERDYPRVKIVKLEENYRSTSNILKAANKIIKHNSQRKDKTLWTNKGKGEPVVVFETLNEYEEAEYVASQILALKKKEGRNENEFLVLYRVHAQSRTLENVFRRSRLPYAIVGGVSFYQRKEIKDLLSYLRILENLSDGISIERIINIPSRKIGKTTVEKIKSFRDQKNITFFEALTKIEIISEKTKEAINSFVNLIRYLMAKKEELSLLNLVKELIHRSNYILYLKEEYIEEEAMQRIENIEEFFSMVKEFEENSEDKDLSSFLSQAQLTANIDHWPEEDDKVSLMTLHNAKGLEFPVVFLVGMEKGIFPHLNALMEDRLEEERRLCYVGITRAKERLFLTWTQHRNWHGVTRESTPSCFLKELEIEKVHHNKGIKNDNLAGRIVLHDNGVKER